MTVPSRYRIAAGIAALLGVMTIIAGSRVLLGANPGYVVVRPVLFFNVVMGAMYVVAAVLMLRAPSHGNALAWIIAEANLAVLIGIVVLRLVHPPVATETLAAMAFRTAAWFGIVAALRWKPRERSEPRVVSSRERP